MFLFGWRKRIALLLCSFIFLGSVSYLTGTISNEQRNFNNQSNTNYLTKSFFYNSSPLRLFNSIFNISLPKMVKENASHNIQKTFSYMKKDNLWNQIKNTIKNQIFKKIFSLRPELKFDRQDLIGNIFYKWVDENILWVIVKFKLMVFDKKTWFYDNFAVIINE
ncbi:hypothetical protein [Mycoplasma parvum]|uniref:Uncharacterized protein n=1 Tax=Mycoplasma parvum str. Indiana TaxID=1403316 RepID=U5NGC0_9MOLU|nr:hypothetical protein [Mycoplasma parvum]AGX89318.1 hypothetical protein PRV_02965 [Mycoplasma parvum str. Indiana]